MREGAETPTLRNGWRALLLSDGTQKWRNTLLQSFEMLWVWKWDHLLEKSCTNMDGSIVMIYRVMFHGINFWDMIWWGRSPQWLRKTIRYVKLVQSHHMIPTEGCGIRKYCRGSTASGYGDWQQTAWRPWWYCYTRGDTNFMLVDGHACV